MDSKSNGRKTPTLFIYILAMIIMGSIGIYRKLIPIGSGALASIRGLIGAAVIILFVFISGKKPDITKIRNNLKYLLLSGALIGTNWVLLFESYSNTTVSVGTLCYYMAPVFVIIMSPFLLKEKIGAFKIICSVFAVFGMVLVSGVLGNSGGATLAGVLFGLGAAVLYAIVIIINKKIHDISSSDKTAVQLFIAGIIVLPYVFLVEKNDFRSLDLKAIIFILIVGIINTGLAYILYFGSFEKMSAYSIAVFSYIDPVTALILSAVILREDFTPLEIAGAVIIIVSSVISHLDLKKTGKKKENVSV